MNVSKKQHLMEIQNHFQIQCQLSRNEEFAQFDKEWLQNHTANITLT